MVKGLLVICGMLSVANLSMAQQNAPEGNQQSRLWAEYSLVQLADQVKLMDEPTSRIFLRLKLATFLWSNGSIKSDSIGAADIIAKEALADLEAHEKELPRLYANLFRRELLALFQLHLPTVAARMIEQDKPERKTTRNEFEIAYSMLGSKDGITQAVEIIRRNLGSGQDPKDMLIFCLGQLQQQHSLELPRLLSEVVAIEERQLGTIPVNTLLQIIKFYLNEETSADLRMRYFDVIVRSVQLNYNSFDESVMQFAYRVLSGIVLPRIQTLEPSLYSRGQGVTAALARRIPLPALDRIAIRERINQSPDSLNQLIIEANATKDDSLRESLLAEAAQLALGKGQTRLAADLVPASSSESTYGSWRDQFLNDVVIAALKQNDTDLAGYAVSKISLAVSRALAFKRMAIYYLEAKNLAYARESLADAIRLIEKNEDDSVKAREYLTITPAVMKIDEVRTTEMIQAAIKAINSIQPPGIDEKPDSATRQAYAKKIVDIGFTIVPVFQSFSQKDEIGSISLASGIQRREVRAFAVLGVYTGIVMANKGSASKARN